MALIYPFTSAANPDSTDYKRCLEEKCQLWDKGVYDKYEPGCGLVSREERRA